MSRLTIATQQIEVRDNSTPGRNTYRFFGPNAFVGLTVCRRLGIDTPEYVSLRDAVGQLLLGGVSCLD